jgi:predicted metal-dependent peptidase
MLDNVRRARTQLVLRHPFFATLVLGMGYEETDKVPTMGTDGKNLYVNPEWGGKLTLEETMGVLAHEALHAGLLHPFRVAQGGYRKDKANIAQDLIINQMLKDEGFVLPGQPVTWPKMMAGAQGHLYDKQYAGLSWEAIYRKLQDPPEGEGGSFAIQGGQKGLSNDVIPNDSPEDQQEANIRTQQAATVAKQQGRLPAGVKGLVEDMLEPKIDWTDIVRDLAKQRARDDYSPRRYQRKLIPQDVYLPSLYSEKMGEMVVCLDTSGSTMGERGQYLAEVAAIASEVQPSKLIIIHCDAQVDKVSEFGPGEYDLCVEDSKEMVGGGGTSFKPPFKWVRDNCKRPEILVYLTDMYGDFPTEEPGYPVVWVSTSPEHEPAPIGQTVQMDVSKDEEE